MCSEHHGFLNSFLLEESFLEDKCTLFLVVRWTLYVFYFRREFFV